MADAANESEWAADRKVGFAMGILLIGVIAALFFRNEPLAIEDAPAVAREDLIDSRLRDRNVSVYSDTTGDDSAHHDQPWTNPELLEEYRQPDAGVALPIGAAPPRQAPQTPPGSIRDMLAAESNESRPRTAPLSFTPPAERPVAVTTQSADADNAIRQRPDLLMPEEPRAADPAEFDEYTIRYGDTLSGIADRKLGSSSRYKEIYEANRDRMSSPDRLKVGTAIRIPRL